MWRLIWAGSGVAIEPLALVPPNACLEDVAHVASVLSPSTRNDSTEHATTALFCSGPVGVATTAQYLLDLPADASGKLKVIALDTTGASPAVIESPEVRFNGGVAHPYPMAALQASSVHRSVDLWVSVVGSGLNTASSMSLAAPGGSWTLPLSITSKTDSTITGFALVAALLPACQVIIGSTNGVASVASLPADEPPASVDPQSCGAQYHEDLLHPPPSPLGFTIQPKDFAFVRGFVDQATNQYALHLFYIRHNYWYYQGPQQGWRPDLDEKNLGHIWTTDFNSWYGPAGLNKPDTLALKVRPGKFDEFHVWAPSIVPNGPLFHMFYTGVRVENGRENQRIGVATSTDLVTWAQEDAVVLSSPEIPWASKNPTTYEGQQLRDPFVMEDPVNPGQWLMYFVAVDSLNYPKMAVGAARSTNLRDWFPLDSPFRSTERPTSMGPTGAVESPHVFRRNGQWWMPYSVNQTQVFFETTTDEDPANTTESVWSNPVSLRSVTEGEPPELQYWHASEHLRINDTEYLAAFNDNSISVDIKGVYPPAVPVVDSVLLSCPELAGVEAGGNGAQIRLLVTRARWGDPEVYLRLELPVRMAVRLVIHDVAGRRLATLLDGELPGGPTDLRWDGRDETGTRVASGMYFVRLSHPSGAWRSKLVMLR